MPETVSSRATSGLGVRSAVLAEVLGGPGSCCVEREVPMPPGPGRGIYFSLTLGPGGDRVSHLPRSDPGSSLGRGHTPATATAAGRTASLATPRPEPRQLQVLGRAGQLRARRMVGAHGELLQSPQRASFPNSGWRTQCCLSLDARRTER